MSANSVTKITSIPGTRRFQFDCLHSPELLPFRSVSMYQLGDLSCDARFALSEHEQVCYEISYVVSGLGWFATGGSRFDLQPGDIYICRPGELHKGGADPADPFRYFYFGFHFNATSPQDNPFQHLREMMDTTQRPVCRDRLGIRSPFMGVLKELSGTSHFSQTMIEAYVEQILVLTYRNFFSDWEDKYPGEGLDNAAKRVVYSAIHYIDDRLMRIKDLKEISDAFGYSLSHLSHLFTKETGDSLRSYYAKRKWQRSIELLAEGHYSITEVAAIMQYDSIHTFSRAFKKAFGLSPSQYIRECKVPGTIAINESQRTK